MADTFPLPTSPPTNCFVNAQHHGPNLVKPPQTLTMITSFYRTKLRGHNLIISITWYCKSFNMGVRGLCVNLDPPSHQLHHTIEIKPWLFWKKQGSKWLDIFGGEKKIKIGWDFSRAKYSNIGPEPLEGYFLTISCEHEVLLLLGDMHREALKKMPIEEITLIEATLVSRKEHVFGNQIYTTRAQFVENGQTHEIVIECHKSEHDHTRLSVRLDRQVVIHVKHLSWKFRGNQTIHVDGSPVEVFWDVHDWLFNSNDGHAVFMFQTCIANDKSWLHELMQEHNNGSSSCHASKKKLIEKHSTLDVSLLHWPTTKDGFMSPQGFSLLLYAWRNY